MWLLADPILRSGAAANMQRSSSNSGRVRDGAITVPNPLRLNDSQSFNLYEALAKYSFLSTHTASSTPEASNSENIAFHELFPSSVMTWSFQRGERLYIRSWFRNRR